MLYHTASHHVSCYIISYHIFCCIISYDMHVCTGPATSRTCGYVRILPPGGAGRPASSWKPRRRPQGSGFHFYSFPNSVSPTRHRPASRWEPRRRARARKCGRRATVHAARATSAHRAHECTNAGTFTHARTHAHTHTLPKRRTTRRARRIRTMPSELRKGGVGGGGVDSDKWTRIMDSDNGLGKDSDNGRGYMDEPSR